MAANNRSDGDRAIETVKLQSSEGKTFEVPLEVAKVSRTLSVMLEGKSKPSAGLCFDRH